MAFLPRKRPDLTVFDVMIGWEEREDVEPAEPLPTRDAVTIGALIVVILIVFAVLWYP